MAIKKYRKIPVEIETLRWDGFNLSEVIEFVGKDLSYEIFDAAWIVGKAAPMVNMKIRTLEGPVNVSVGDVIIKGVAGEFYPCKPDIFEQTYQEVKDEESDESEDVLASLENLLSDMIAVGSDPDRAFRYGEDVLVRDINGFSEKLSSIVNRMRDK